jgi:hypothetical protein
MEWFALLGMLSIVLVLVVMAVFSRRLGRVTKAFPHYVGFLIGAAFVAIGFGVRLLDLLNGGDSLQLQHDLMRVLLYNGMPAAGVTIGVMTAWRYWSWLLAERG